MKYFRGSVHITSRRKGGWGCIAKRDGKREVEGECHAWRHDLKDYDRTEFPGSVMTEPKFSVFRITDSCLSGG